VSCCPTGPTATFGNPTNTEDDITIISNTLPLLPDEAGNTAATATPICTITACTPLTSGSTRSRAVVNAVAHSGDDVDYYSFVAADAGPMNITLQYVTGVTEREAVMVRMPSGEDVEMQVTMAYRR
jgi:hypothetical protein